MMFYNLLILIQLLSSLAYSNTFVHSTPRVAVDPNVYPWQTIGKIRDCTASLVGERFILTNKHCVFSLIDGVYNPNLKERRFELHTENGWDWFWAKPLAWGDGNSRESDWMIMALRKPVGFWYGYFGVEAKVDGVIQRVGAHHPRHIEIDLVNCIDTSTHHNLEADSIIPKSQLNSITQCLAGFPGDLGGDELVLSTNCGIRDYTSHGTLLHDCPTTRGSSGSALFYQYLENPYITSLHAAERRNDEDESLMNVDFELNNANISIPTDNFFHLIKKFRELEGDYGGRLEYDEKGRVNRYAPFTFHEDVR